MRYGYLPASVLCSNKNDLDSNVFCRYTIMQTRCLQKALKVLCGIRATSVELDDADADHLRAFRQHAKRSADLIGRRATRRLYEG